MNLPDTVAPTDLGPLPEQARAYLCNSKAPSTLRAYRSDWQHFAAWCDGRCTASLPATPSTVALYVSGLRRNPPAGDHH